LLKSRPIFGGARPVPPVARAAAEGRFRHSAKRFAALPSATAATQRAWRGFRMATFSRERDDATLPKIWTLFALLRARQRELWRLP